MLNKMTNDDIKKWLLSYNSFVDLGKIALTNLSDGEIARNALCMLICDNKNVGLGNHFSSSENAIKKAVNAFINTCHSDSYAVRYHLLQIVKYLFLETSQISYSTKISLLESLELLVKPISNGYRIISDHDLSNLLISILKAHLQDYKDAKSIELQIKILSLLALYPNKDYWLIVDAIKKAHPNQELKNKCNSILQSNKRKETVTYIWQETICDVIANQKFQAKYLKDAFNKDLPAIQLIRAIFNYTKGSPAKDNKDPRLPYLEFALHNENEAIRLAAARAIMQSSSELGQIWQEALKSIADIAVNSQIIENANDALTILTEIEQMYPQEADLITEAKEAANKNFIGNNPIK